MLVYNDPPPMLANFDSLRGSRVLITGGLGFIGSNLALRCVEDGAEVTIYDCLDPKSGGNLYNISSIRDDIELVISDVRNFEAVATATTGMDIVFNCAAYTSHPNSMIDPLNDLDVNCKGMLNVLEAIRRFNPECKLVHLGTSTQIGRMRFSPVTEDHPEFPVDIYSANKSAAEKYALVYSHSYGIRGTVVRLANVYGPRSNIRNSDFGFINYFIGLGLQGRALTVFGEGAQLRNISYVDDCVSALLRAAKHEEANGEAIFAVADEQCSVMDIANAIATHIGGSVRNVPWPKDRQVIEIGDAVICNDKAKRLLDWQPKWNLQDGLQQTREYFSTCLEHYA